MIWDKKILKTQQQTKPNIKRLTLKTVSVTKCTLKYLV